MRPSNLYYILKDRKPVPATLFEWGEFMSKKKRHVAKSTLLNGLWVSTIFLGLVHWEDTLFESMVFKSRFDMEEVTQRRYKTWDEAAAGHKTLVKEYSPEISFLSSPKVVKMFFTIYLPIIAKTTLYRSIYLIKRTRIHIRAQFTKLLQKMSMIQPRTIAKVRKLFKTGSSK